jgi:16S rRNA (guanine(966)-N(2))-methyltransferase RsmD
MRIIAGEARGRRIEAPEGRNTRPTLDRVRENLFNMLQGEIDGSGILDLFAGSGALSYEALSRGAAYAFLVDHDRKASAVQRKNAETLGYLDRTEIITADWRKALKDIGSKEKRFDIVFLDPPYAMLNLNDVFTGLISVLGEDALIILEHEAGKHPEIPDGFECIKQRCWGFCGVSIFRRNSK